MGIGAWESLPSPSIGICIPHVGLVFTEWAMNFKALQLPGHCEIYNNRGLPIDHARNQLVKQCLDAKMDYVFFLDSDTIAPPEAISQLLLNKLPIVSGIYRNKRDYAPAAWRRIPEWKPGTNSPKYLAINKYDGILTDVDVIGMGCCLIETKVFRMLKYPWYDWTINLDNTDGVGEDFYFCEKAKEAGFRVYVDARVLCDHEALAKIGRNDGAITQATI